MTYFKLISKYKDYFKSIRIIKNYISFDLFFPESWIVKEGEDNIEVIKSKDKEGNPLTSFVTVFEEANVDLLESKVNGIISTNLEIEEKKRLFDEKVIELKSLFQKEDLENLRNIKFNSSPNLTFEENKILDDPIS